MGKKRTRKKYRREKGRKRQKESRGKQKTKTEKSLDRRNELEKESARQKFNRLTLTLLWVWWGRCEKNYLPKEEEREGGEKSVRSVPEGAGARTWDLPRARQESPAAHHGGCLDKQAFPCL